MLPSGHPGSTRLRAPLSAMAVLSSSSRTPVPRTCSTPVFPRLILWIIFYFSCIRVGEATHPGPVPQDTSVVIGCANPTGLLGKAHLAAKLPGVEDSISIWGFTETHLTKRGVNQFQRDLHFARSNKLTFTPGGPAEYLSNHPGSIGGDARGVGIMSSIPGRPLQHDWDQPSWDSGRVQVAAYHIGPWWTSIGIAYGFAYNSHTARTKKQTNHLLGLLTKRVVVQSHGPRILMGDWNMPNDDVEFAPFWREQGFFDLQEFALHRWGRAIQPTYKAKSTIDHIWLSREFAPWIQDLGMDSTWFADHSIIYAKLRMPFVKRPPEIWIKPLAMPWDEVAYPNECAPAQVDGKSSSDAYSSIMASLETYVDTALLSQGKPGLAPTQRGRATTVETKRVKAQAPPLKRARPHDVQATFIGEHWQHYHWFRQLRRLIHLQHLIAAQPHANAQTLPVWQSILAASGFPGGFRMWWKHRAIRTAHALNHLPRAVPTFDQLAVIVLNFKQEVRALENSLNQQRATKAKLARIEDPHKLYQDLKSARPLPVQTLLLHNHAEVLACEDAQVTVEEGSLSPDLPVMMHGKVISAEWISPTTFAVDPEVTVEIGDELQQPEYTADSKVILKQFEDLWQQRWDKHRHVPEDKWLPFCDMLTSLLPEPLESMPYHRITPEQWYEAVRRKKSKTACGPDGVSRLDLLNCPRSLTDQILEMLYHIECGEPWPATAMTGIISTLEKVEMAHHPNQFRPICILSLIYRVWASIRTKQLVQWLSALCPCGLYGNRPGHDTSQLWWNLALQIESALLEDIPIHGTLGDLVKCFNTLPRLPVFHIASRLKIPSGILQPWFNAISQLERRFSVLGEVGVPLRSTTGFPEGDPLSIVAMMLLNIGMDAYVTQSHPNTRLLTYVDNIELVGSTIEDVTHAVSTLRSFCDSLDLELDQPKQLFWSTCKQARKHLRDQDIAVTYHVRDLGGQMTYCRRHVNKVIQQRIKSMTEHWHKLSRSTASYRQKLNSLVSAAWPKALHGVAIVKLGDAHIAKLRTGAMKGLGSTNKGISPLLHLSFLHGDVVDPGFYTLWQTVLCFRRYANPADTWHVLDHLAAAGDKRQDPGPCAVLLQRMNAIAWSWHSNGWFFDHEGIAVHLLDSPIQQLRARLRAGWYAKVGAELATSRASFAGLELVDPSFTVSALSDHTEEDQAIMRIVLNGGFYTRDNLIHSGKTDSKQCPWCPATDSVAHRHWSCPFMSEVRGSVDEDFAARVPDMKPCTATHGWFCQLPSQREFLTLLHNLPDVTRQWEVPEHLPDVLHLFTDGSALYPHEPRIRLASWGVVLANLEADVFVPLSRGVVHGIVQTVLRGEIMAALSALWFLHHAGRDGAIWSDNQQVCDNIAAFQGGQLPPSNLEPNHDLWAELYDIVQLLGRSLIKCVKVPSHEDHSMYEDTVHLWALRGNDSADKEAAGARQDMQYPIRHCWDRLVAEHHAQQSDKHILHQHFLAVGRRAVRHGSTRPIDPADEVECDDHHDAEDPPMANIVDDTPLQFETLPDWDQRSDSISLGICGPEVYNWLHVLTTSEDSQLSWVSMYQLTISYQIFSQSIGPFLISKSWVPGEQAFPQGIGYNFLNQSKQFAHFLKTLGRAFGMKVVGTFRRPTCTEMIPVWCRCYKMNISNSMMRQVDDRLRDHHSSPYVKMKRDFKDFPIASGP
eukprot:Skav222606  [mRNA]  locus=scaffold5038:163421:168487:- [translate_table: standard]